MINEDTQRLIRPEQVMKQVEWDKLEAVVILGLGRKGEKNVLHMSTLTINELALLSAQLQAHLHCLLGPMNEK